MANRPRGVSLSYGPKFSWDLFLLFSGWKCAVFGFVFFNFWLLFDDDALPPNGTYFHLLMIFIAGHFTAKLAYYCRLPPMVGMLVSGFIYGNAFDVNLNSQLTEILRSMTLMVILLRAGFNVNPSKIGRLSFVCFRLSIIPSLVEALAVAVGGYFLFNLSLSWSLLLGFVIASIAPAIDVPEMIECRRVELGVTKGIPTLIIASASLDNVFAITGFSMCLSSAFDSQSLFPGMRNWELALKGPAEAMIGVAYGITVGLILWYLPERCTNYPRSCASLPSRHDLHRFLILILSATTARLASQHFDLGGAGPLAILVLAFVAALRWKPRGLVNFTEDCLQRMWLVLEVYLFTLVAADVRLHTLQLPVLYYGAPLLVGAILLRMFTAFLVCYGIQLNTNERLFVAIAWFPKASVQAAVGSIALDRATNAAEADNGRVVLTLAVLSIILTAPLGVLILDYCAHRLLTTAPKITDHRAMTPLLGPSTSAEPNSEKTRAEKHFCRTVSYHSIVQSL